jgi:hypothetical protein
MEPFTGTTSEGSVYAYVIGCYDCARKRLSEPYAVERWNYEDIKKYDEITVLDVQSLPQSKQETEMILEYIRGAKEYNVRLILPSPLSAYSSSIRAKLNN